MAGVVSFPNYEYLTETDLGKKMCFKSWSQMVFFVVDITFHKTVDILINYFPQCSGYHPLDNSDRAGGVRRIKEQGGEEIARHIPTTLLVGKCKKSNRIKH